MTTVMTTDGREVEPCTKYDSCRRGSPNVCGECLRVNNPPEPVKVRIPRPRLTDAVGSGDVR